MSRSPNKEQQAIPDCVLDLMAAGSFVNAFDGADSVRVVNGVMPVVLKGKSFKIHGLES